MGRPKVPVYDVDIVRASYFSNVKKSIWKVNLKIQFSLRFVKSFIVIKHAVKNSPKVQAIPNNRKCL